MSTNSFGCKVPNETRFGLHCAINQSPELVEPAFVSRHPGSQSATSLHIGPKSRSIILRSGVGFASSIERQCVSSSNGPKQSSSRTAEVCRRASRWPPTHGAPEGTNLSDCSSSMELLFKGLQLLTFAHPPRRPNSCVTVARAGEVSLSLARGGGGGRRWR